MSNLKNKAFRHSLSGDFNLIVVKCCVPDYGIMPLSCFVSVLANTPGGVTWSGLGAHVYWVIIRVSKLV